MSAEKEVALVNHLSIIQDLRVVGRTRTPTHTPTATLPALGSTRYGGQ
jgi:hypothetical protein